MLHVIISLDMQEQLTDSVSVVSPCLWDSLSGQERTAANGNAVVNLNLFSRFRFDESRNT